MNKEEQKEQWLAERLKYVGASEISTVIKSECTEDEIRDAMGSSADEFIKDKLFTSPFCLYNYKKELATPPPFSPILSEFGHEMEKYAVMDFNQKHYEIISEGCERINAYAENKPQELICCKKLHKLCAYTPDAFIEFGNDKTLHKDVIKKDRAVFEIKTSNLFTFYKENWGIPEGQEEVKFQYIIQAQYQLWIQNKINPNFKWAVLACILPKENDNDFWKGKAVAWCQDLTDKNFKKLQENYAVYYWIYPIFKTLHKLFEIALNRWSERLQNCSEPKMDYENINDNKIATKLIKNNKIFTKYFEELKVKAQTKFGTDKTGIIKLTPELQIKYPNLYDMLQIDKLNRETVNSTQKTIDKTKSMLLDFCLKEKGVGFDTDTATFHLSRCGGGFSIKSNFKTKSETMRGETKISKFLERKI